MSAMGFVFEFQVTRLLCKSNGSSGIGGIANVWHDSNQQDVIVNFS